MVNLNFSTTQAGQTARKYLRTPRSVRRRHHRIDGRVRAAQAIKLKVHQYTRAIGAAAKDPLTKARIAELAELEVLTSELRAAGLRGEKVNTFDLYQLTRFTNTINRLRESLGLNAAPSDESESDPLAELERLKFGGR
jgi:hypothetical protein